MIVINNTETSEFGRQLRGIRLPRWDELPDFGLYLDQVLGLLIRALDGYNTGAEKLLTSSMVNNYVKMGAIPAPERKKYYRPHLALLLVICILKPVMSISDIAKFLSSELTQDDGCGMYNRFCETFEGENAFAVESAAAAVKENGDTGVKEALVRSALRACAERAVAQEIINNIKENNKNE